MKKRVLSQGIILYIFEPIDQLYYGNNIVAVINDNKAILIDAGYTDQMKEVIIDLEESNVSVEGVIVSHFHQSHMQGLKQLPGVTVYGSCHFLQTLELCINSEEEHYYTPTVLVEKNRLLQFGMHTLEMIINPGHSLCTMFVKIDKEFLYIADELIYSPTGKLVLPRVRKNDIINHYISVHNLKRYSYFTLIPGHGEVLNDQDRIENDIRNVCLYLCEILSNDNRLSVEEAMRQCTCDFLHKEWHDNIYE